MDETDQIAIVAGGGGAIGYKLAVEGAQVIAFRLRQTHYFLRR